MKLPSAKKGAVYLAGGTLAGVAVATHSVILIPVLAAGVAWIGISQHHKRSRRINYKANAAAPIKAKRLKEKRRAAPGWQVRSSQARARSGRARQGPWNSA
jgi:hypothetical protein